MGFVRYPDALGEGSRIVVTAPSSGVEQRMWARLDLVLANLRAQGFVVEEGKCLRQQQEDASAPAVERAAELMHALQREDVAAVFPPWGGELAIELLSLLDWEALSVARPKWLLGYSDLSTLMLPLLLKCGWASAHGPNLMDLSPDQTDPLTRGALSMLRTPVAGYVEQQSSARWQRRYEDFSHNPRATFRLTEPTRWWALGGEQQLHVKGRVLAGCLDTWMHLVGTPYGYVPVLQRRMQPDGCLLFLENCELSPVSLVRALCQMRAAGWFDGVHALLLGRSNAPATERPGALDYENAVRHALSGLTCPVLMDVDFGHKPPQLTLVQGALAELSFRANEGANVIQFLT
jgi:muramoyltetrapeptide carboxypeptidase